MAALTESPCTRAASILSHTLKRYHIHSIAQLNQVGMDGLLRCAGIGERSTWVAALILDDCAYDVEAWMDRTPVAKTVTSRAAKIRLVHGKTAKQKHG